jgi:starvation-inducible DNA-binding protein
MPNKKSANGTIVDRVRAVGLQTSKEIQHFGTIARLPIALDASICAASVENLNQVLVDTKTLTDMYKKHHWQVSGPSFYQLHLLFDKHFKEQSDLVDALAERIQSLGGISIAMAHDVAEMTLIPRVPRGREAVAVQISRLLHAHEIILKEARAMARQAAEAGDDGTNDLLVSDVIRTNEMQVWFLGEHVVDEPLVHADKQDDR